MQRTFIFTLLILSFCSVLAQNGTMKEGTDFHFILRDSPSQLFTMRQFNENYLSGSRLLSRGLYAVTRNENVADLIQVGLQTLLLVPLTHEEGHRSILTTQNIGSVSQPYFNRNGAAYVKGVRDQTLQNLRDNDLPTYIRIHTAGLESDYMLTRRMESTASFNQDNFKNFKWEYTFRKIAIMQYYLLGLVGYEVNLKEEVNELDRDVAGYDTYGAVRHLFRPTMEFYRYTNYRDLTDEEADFVSRLGTRSLMNLLNPLLLFGKENFKLTETTSFNLGMGYTMSPFGDFMDENLWLKHQSFNFGFYARQFQNKEHWFNGLGLSLVDYPLTDRLQTNVSGHFWRQPVNFDFNTADYFSGGAIDMDLRIFIPTKKNIAFKGYSFDLGFIYKTKGFLPEEMYMDENWGLRVGTTLRL